MDDQAAHSAPSAPQESSKKPSLLITWLAVSTLIVSAAYIQSSGLMRLAGLTQLLSGYDVFNPKIFDVPRLPPCTNFEIIGQKGGKLSAIAVQGKYAYVGAGESLLVVSIENPQHVETIASLLLLGQITDIKIEGSYAYICNGRGGLRIVDIGNPLQPKEVAAYGHIAVPKRACIHSGCAYIASGMRGLEVLDVENPVRPAAVGFQDAADKYETLDAQDICIDHDRLCVMDEDQGLRLFDIKNPRSPSRLGEWKAGGRGLRRGAAAVEGKTILIAGDSPDQGLSLLSIDGSKPELTSSLDVPPYWYGSSAKIHDGLAYIGTSSGLLIVDIHDRKKPRRLAAFDKVKGIVGVDIEGKIVYATNSAGDLSIIDAGKPDAPFLVSSQHLGGDERLMAIIDGRLYSTSGPAKIDSFQLPISEKTSPSIQTFDFQGPRAICQTESDLVVLDDRFPASGGRISLVTLLEKHPDGSLKEKWSQKIDKSNREVASNKKSIFAATDDGIQIFSKEGKEKYFYSMKTGADHLCASDNCLYVTTETGPKNTVLITFDVTDPKQLKKLGQVSIDERAYSLVTDKRHVYILEGGVWGDRELSIFDKAKDGLVRAGTLKIKQADRLAVDGRRAYVQGFLAVNSVDITDAHNPQLVGAIDLSAIPLATSDIKAKDGTVYIAGQDGGIYVLKDKSLN